MTLDSSRLPTAKMTFKVIWRSLETTWFNRKHSSCSNIQ